MAVPALIEENILIFQGADFRKTYVFEDANDGNTAYAPIKLWSDNGPDLGEVTTSVSASAQRVTITIPASVTALMKRSGVYDVYIDDGFGLHPFRSGKAIVRARVNDGTSSASATNNWGLVRYGSPGRTWRTIKNSLKSWRDLI